MRLPKFRLRTLMVAVAIAGLACSLPVMSMRSCRLAQMCGYYHLLSIQAEKTLKQSGQGIDETTLRRRIKHYRHLEAKYDHAFRRPWLPVKPDPPEPE